MGANDQGANATQDRWIVIPRTLCLVTHGSDILLLKRSATTRIFPNKYNGLGGHIERDEDPISSAIREIQEETGLEVQNVRLRGISNIDSGQQAGIMLFIITAEAINREFVDSEEGTLEWVPLDRVYEKDLVEDFPLLLPRLFGNHIPDHPFSAHVSYDHNDRIIYRFVEIS